MKGIFLMFIIYKFFNSVGVSGKRGEGNQGNKTA